MDKEKFLGYFNNEKELIAELISLFKQSYPDTFEKLKRAIAEKDFSNLELHAHTLKGMIVNFFSEELRQAAYNLEKMGHDHKLDKPQVHIDILEKGIVELVDEMEGLL